MPDWRELEAAVHRSRRALERSRYDMPRSQREQLQRDLDIMEREAKRQRDEYSRWLWGR